MSTLRPLPPPVATTAADGVARRHAAAPAAARLPDLPQWAIRLSGVVKVLAQRLEHPPVLVGMVSVVVVATVFFALYDGPDRLAMRVDYGTDALLVAGVLALSLRRARSSSSRRPRRFWWSMGLAFAAWLPVTVMLFWTVDRSLPLPLGLAADCLYAAYYFFALHASLVTLEPWTRRSVSPLERVDVAGTLAFVIIGLTYFVLVPARVNRDAYQGMYPSLTLYILLDLVLAIRFLRLASRASRPEIAAVDVVLVAAFASSALSEALTELWLSGRLDIGWSSPANVLWYLPMLGVGVAAAIGPEVEGSGRDRAELPVPEPERMAPSAPLPVFVLLMPALHFGLYGLGLLDEESRQPREMVVFVGLVALVSLAILQRRLVRQRAGQLQQQIETMNERLLQSHNMEALGKLAGGMAHDFNNILTVILGYSDSLRRRLVDEPAALDLAERILDASRRASSLTRQLLAFSRQGVMEATVVDLNAVLAGMEDMLRRLAGEDVRFRVQLASGLWPVRADPRRLEQVILNLVANARDAMPSGGELLLATENVQVDGWAPGTAGLAPGSYAMLRVSDSGKGMDRETLQRVFEPFFTTKEVGRGTGLGLALVHGVVKQCGGEIVVESEEGCGTTFRIYLCRAEEREATAAVEAARSSGAAGGRGSVWVIEDEGEVRAMVEAVLQGAGYAVRSFAAGEEALAAFDGDARPDLVLSDVVMAGLSGADVVRRLRHRAPQLPVLLMSGYTQGRLEESGVDLSRQRFLAKPFTPADLLGRVQEALTEHRATAAT